MEVNIVAFKKTKKRGVIPHSSLFFSHIHWKQVDVIQNSDIKLVYCLELSSYQHILYYPTLQHFFC